MRCTNNDADRRATSARAALQVAAVMALSADVSEREMLSWAREELPSYQVGTATASLRIPPLNEKVAGQVPLGFHVEAFFLQKRCAQNIKHAREDQAVPQPIEHFKKAKTRDLP